MAVVEIMSLDEEMALIRTARQAVRDGRLDPHCHRCGEMCAPTDLIESPVECTPCWWKSNVPWRERARVRADVYIGDHSFPPLPRWLVRWIQGRVG